MREIGGARRRRRSLEMSSGEKFLRQSLGLLTAACWLQRASLHRNAVASDVVTRLCRRAPDPTRYLE
jgi:hypothetical protein